MSICPTCCAWAAACWAGGAERRRGSRRSGRVRYRAPDQLTFLQPIHVGELVTLLASVNYTGRSSMEIGIKVITENIREQVVRHANSCFFTMVAVGDDGKPAAAAPLEPVTPDQKRRWRAAICG